MPRRDVAIEIFAPVEGLHTELPSSMITPRSTPHVSDCNAYFGVVQKEYGTSLFATGNMGTSISYIYQAQFPAEPTLQVFTHTRMGKHASGTYGQDGQIYTGALTDYWHACMHNDAMVYSNGVDLLQYKAAYNSTGTDMAGVVAASYKALAVVSFKDHLNLYHTTEGGSASPKRVRWTNVGLLGYTTTDWTEGTAGFLDLQDADGKLLTAEKLGAGAVAVYAEGSIHIQEWVGGDSVYRFTKVLSNLDIPSRRCVAENDAVHFIIMRDGVYEYRGGRDLQYISEPIRQVFNSVINASNMDKSFIQFVREDAELRVYVPTDDSTSVNKCYVCKVKDNYSWWESDRPYTAKGEFTVESGITIGDLVGNIGAQNYKLGDLALKSGAPGYLLGDKSGRVVKMDKTLYSVSESGTAGAQTFIFDTKDLSSIKDIDPLLRDKYRITQYMDNYNRWWGVNVEAKGNGAMILQYSTDDGVNFTAFPESPVTLDSPWVMYEADCDVAAQRFMLRISNTATNEVVHVRYVKVLFTPGGEA